VTVLLGQGRNPVQLTRAVEIKTKTVKNQIASLREKFSLDSQHEMAIPCALRLGAVQIMLAIREIPYPGPPECVPCTRSCMTPDCSLRQ